MKQDADKNYLLILKKKISKEKKLVEEIDSLFHNLEKKKGGEKGNSLSKIEFLREILKKTNNSIPEILERVVLVQPLPFQTPAQTSFAQKEMQVPEVSEGMEMEEAKVAKLEAPKPEIPWFEKETLKRLKKKKEEEIVEIKLKKPSRYVKISNNFFSDISLSLLKKKRFRTLKRDLIKANLSFLPTSYISVILFTTLLSFVSSLFIMTFLLFFSIGAEWPIISSVSEKLSLRFLKVFWIIFVIPIGTFLFMYIYPSLEKKSVENRINQELPFVVIHMAAISGSMVEPSKIFSIIITIKEYPYIEKEFTKLINKINIYGYDLVSALRNCSFNTSSKRLAELFNGLATTITSGGDLPDFFDKRAQTLLFEHRLNREKYTRTAETFMDIYISVVIAAPMILMLLLMMIRISGLGISLSTSMITLLVILGVSVVNIIFLTFLHLKQGGRE